MQGVILVPNIRRDILWLDSGFAMCHSTWDQSGSIIVDRLGGIFASPPVAVSTSPGRLDVFGLASDYSVYHKVQNAAPPDGGSAWTDWDDLGGNLTSTPVVVSTAATRIDLFGLGIDQGLVHRAWDGSDWTAWELLGGCFTSQPSVVPVGSGVFDLFARGLDFKIYHMRQQSGISGTWELLGGGLLGEPVAASAPTAIRVGKLLFVFASGADGAVWYTLFDSTVWRPWTSLGYAQAAIPGGQDPVTFISEPVVTALSPLLDAVVGSAISSTSGGAGSRAMPPAAVSGHLRVDVFAVGSDRALWHGWLDSKGWHGQTDTQGNQTGGWESLGGQLMCAPSVIGSGRSRSSIAMPPVRFDAVEAGLNGRIARLSFDGTQWSRADTGQAFRLPSCYYFSVDSVSIQTTRSLLNDTDHAATTLAVGTWPVLRANQEMGDVGGDVGGPDSAILNLLNFDYVIVELCEPVAFAYSIVNSGNNDIAKAVVQGLLNAGASKVSDFVKSQINPPNTVTVDVSGSGGGLTADVLTDVGGGIAGGVVGGLAGAALTVIINQVLALVFADCDGIVAANLIPYQRGRDLQTAIRRGAALKIEERTPYPGTVSPSGCGANSYYTVYWSVTHR